MKKIPTIGKFLDDEEKEIYEAIERDDYKVGKNFLTPARSTTASRSSTHLSNDRSPTLQSVIPQPRSS